MNPILEELMNRITLNKILATVAIFIGVMIFATTLAVVTKPKPVTVVRAQTQTPAEEKLSSYKELGKLRVVTAPDKNGKNPSTVVVNPLLSYTFQDQDFYEELSRKNPQIKSIIVNYFSSQTSTQLKVKGETKIKNELLEQLNQILVLNKIQDLFFDDLIFLE